jgi:His-Xaa-Ser system radical SAM maturase HxsC
MGHRALLIEESRLTILPDDISVVFSDSLNNKLLCLEQFDVVAIDSYGILRSLYLNASDSNALFVGTCCNCNCLMCPYSETARKEHEMLPIERLMEIVDYIPSDAPYITVTGGEPTLLRGDFLNLVRYLNFRLSNTFIQYLTNGRAFANMEFGLAFRNLLRPNNRVAIPIHGPDAKLHDYITQTCHSFDQAVQGIQFLESSSAELEIRIVVSKLNYDKLLDIAKFIVGTFKKITCVNFIGLEMLGNAVKNAESIWIDYKNAFQYIKPAIDFLISNNQDVGLYNFPLCAVDGEYWEICARSISDYKVSFEKQCSECSVREMCGGLFQSTSQYGKLTIQPVENET